MNLIVRGAYVVDPAKKRDEVLELHVRDGIIRKIGKSISEEGAQIIHGKGLHLFPGLIDLHTHFREPGGEGKETVLTGARAAIRGGFVASVSMPNTQPPCDSQSVIDNVIRKAKEVPYNIFPAGTISKKREGKELSEMADMKQAGIVAVTDDGDWVADTLLMRRAMEYASMLDLIVMSHCEDKQLSGRGVMNEGLSSTRLGLRGMPNASEDVAAARDIELARLTGARLHLCHVSTARSVELIRRAKQEGIGITAEVTPHHLSLTDEAVEGYNTNCKVNPPLRKAPDLAALRAALHEGIIDCVATDHAPHTQEDKMKEFDNAPFGIIGLETALGVVLDELYHRERWSLAEIVRVMAVRPAEILRLGPGFGSFEEGAPANFCLVDLDKEWTVNAAEFKSKSKNSPFLGRTLRGRVQATFCAGKFWEFVEGKNG